jgi:uncharacterized protein YqeY
VLEKYLPAAIGELELEAALKDIISRVGAKGPSDMGG